MTQSETISEKSKSSFKSKKPWPLLILSACFLLSPFFNLASSLYVGGHLKWYSPIIWTDLFRRLSLPEQTLMLSDVAVAILLFTQNKRSWFFALFLVIFTACYNIFSESTNNNGNFAILSYVNIAATLGVFAILYFFRYPYLDKRDSVLQGEAPRERVNIKTSIRDRGACEITDISKTGCKIILVDSSSKPLLTGDQIELALTSTTSVACTVVHTNNGYGLKFVKPSSEAKKQILQWIR